MAPIPPPASKTVEAIYASYAERRSAWRSAGLAVSELGAECDRFLWYQLRWVEAAKSVEGRKARLFDTGDREEQRLLDDLRAIGVQVEDRDPDGKQWPMRAVAGHVRGKADAALLGVPDAPATWHLFEAKTMSAKNYRALVKHGLQEAEPKHYAQCQLGMHILGLTRALYLAVSKDTDEIHAERVDHDPAYCLRLLARAERIVAADRPPARLHDDPASKAAFACQWCPALAQCHQQAWPDSRNCRTCLHSQPTMGGDGEWRCARFGKALTLDEQRAGCGSHLYLPDLVPGTQEDVDPDRETVTYRLATGALWVDGAANG